MALARASHHAVQRHQCTPTAAPAPVVEYITPAPVNEYMASALVNEYGASARVIEYVAPALVTILLMPPVPVAHFVQVLHVQVVQKTTENPQLQIIAKSVETPVTLFAQGSQTSESLGPALVRLMKPAEIFDVAGLEPPLPGESGPPMCASTPVVDAFPVVVERAQPAPVAELVAPAPAVSCAASAPVVELVDSTPAVSCAAPTPAVEFVDPTPAVTFVAPATVVECLAPAPLVTYEAPTAAVDHSVPVPAVTYVASAPVGEDFAPALAVSHAALALVVEYIAPVSVKSYAAPAPAVEYDAPAPAATIDEQIQEVHSSTTSLLEQQERYQRLRNPVEMCVGDTGFDAPSLFYSPLGSHSQWRSCLRGPDPRPSRG